MKPLTLQQVRQAVAGRSLYPLRPDMPPVRAVCTDTRDMKPQSLFVALRGDKFDAHQFLIPARDAGAVAAVVEVEPATPVEGLILIKVDDTRKALGRLARFVRKGFTNTKVIAVAGSNGKTSTKHLIDALLSTRLRGSMSPKSFNNDIGVPLTLLPVESSAEYVVVELGTNHPGEIARLAHIAAPDIAVITNCSAEHLEGLGDLAGVRRENASLITDLNPKGLLIVHGDDPDLLAAVAPYPGRRLTFGLNSSNDLFATDIRTEPTGTRFRLNGSRLELFVPLLGRHNAINALAAVAVARRMGLNDEQLDAGLRAVRQPDMRMQMSEIGGIKLLNDAYNANPASMRAGLETLVSLPCTGRRVAVIGEMRELGDSSEAYHRQIGQLLATLEIDQVHCVSPGGRVIADAAINAGFDRARIQTHPDAPAAAAAIPRSLLDGDLVLLKASRGIHLETVAQAIRAAHDLSRQAG